MRWIGFSLPWRKTKRIENALTCRRRSSFVQSRWMKFTRLVTELAISHTVGSYFGTITLCVIFIWIGMRDAGIILFAIFAPLTLPLMALATFRRDGVLTLGGLAILSPIYAVSFAVTWLLLLRRQRRLDRLDRIARGLCPNCGYDLAGNTSGVCPECGTRIVKGPRSIAS